MSAADERVQHYCADGVCTPSRHALTGAEALEKINERQYTPVKQSGGLPAWVVIGGAVVAVGIGGQVVWEFDRELMDIPSLVTGQLVIPAAFFTAIGLVVWFVWSRLGRTADPREMERQAGAAQQEGWGARAHYSPPPEWEQPAAAESARQRRQREAPPKPEQPRPDPVVYRSRWIHVPPEPQPERETHEQAAARYEQTIWERMNADADRNLYDQ